MIPPSFWVFFRRRFAAGQLRLGFDPLALSTLSAWSAERAASRRRLLLFAMLLPCAVRPPNTSIRLSCNSAVASSARAFQVVADDDESARPVVDHLRETCACGPVEVVGRSSSRVTGVRRTRRPVIAISIASPPERVSTRRSRSTVVKPISWRASSARASMSQSYAHGVEVARIGVSGFDGPERCDDPVDTQEFGDCRVLAGGQRWGRYPTSTTVLTRPDVGRSSPAISRSSVDLPAPFRPTRPVRPV